MRRLKELRKKQQLSLRDLAKISGVHYSTISRIENGEFLPNLAILAKLARALKVPIEELIDEEELAAIL